MIVVRRWWRRRRAAKHEPWCPVSFAFIPTWAVNPSTTAVADRVKVLHPPQQCAGCPADVWWYAADQMAKRGNLYCSPACLFRAGHAEPIRPRRTPAQHVPSPVTCPRPDKLAFLTREDAEDRFTALLLTEPAFEVYQCPGCLLWHGGRDDGRVDDGQRIGTIARFGKLRRSA